MASSADQTLVSRIYLWFSDSLHNEQMRLQHGVVMWIISDSNRLLCLSAPSLPSFAFGSRAFASSVPRTGSALPQLDEKHELNTTVALDVILKELYTLLQIFEGLCVYFLGTR